MTDRKPLHERALGAVLRGKYRVLRVIGEGAIGAVYEAEAPGGEHVAIKLMAPEAVESIGSHMLTRFVREANISAYLPSEHIVPVLDGAIDPDTSLPFLVMPLMRGSDLEALLARVGPLEPEIAVRIVMQAGAGLRQAHQLGIVHRDIKPSNIFLDEVGNGRVVAKLCDFGIAKIKPVDERQITRTGVLLGSPIYMSPEQLINPRAVDGRADVFSLAITLYHALAGKPPLAAVKAFAELLLAVTTRDMPPLQTFAPWVDPGLARVVHGALLRPIDDRCPSVDAFLDALAPYAGDTTELLVSDLHGIDTSSRPAAPELAALPHHWEPGATEETALTERAHDPRLGTVLGGRFRLDRLVHEGATGTSFEGTTQDDQQRCFVKLVSPTVLAGEGDLAERFTRQLEAARAIRSDNVARVLGFGLDDAGAPFVAYELLEGRDLGAYLRELGPLDPSLAAKVFVQLCQAMSAVHAAGIIHQNLKPSTIFLHQAKGGKLVPKITDVGLSPRVDLPDPSHKGPLRARVLTLSPMYMSPEQATGKAVSHRTDVWGIAVCLYEALSGQKPRHGFSTVGDILAAAASDDLATLRDLAPWVEAGLADAVAMGLAVDPAKRYASMRDFAFALGPFASGAGPLSIGNLRGVPRSSVVVRAARSGDQNALGTADTLLGPAHSDGPNTLLAGTAPRPRKRVAEIAFALIGVIAVAAAIAFALRPQAPAPTPPKPIVRARVAISPPDATPRVNGTPRPVSSGSFEVEGAPGDLFDVEVSHGSARLQTRVRLVSDGEAQPRSIALPSR